MKGATVHDLLVLDWVTENSSWMARDGEGREICYIGKYHLDEGQDPCSYLEQNVQAILEVEEAPPAPPAPTAPTGGAADDGVYEV